MKQANNNEVDLLLRSLARHSRGQLEAHIASVLEDEKRTISDHLDADELNSYAEGVVPGAARARYTEHLADCASCRRIVIGLTQAAGATPRYEGSEQQDPAGVWQKLAALFSPMVLRYAVPALALTAVIAMSLLLLRQRHTDFVAQNQHPDSQVVNGPAQAELPPGPSTIGTQSTDQKGTESPANAVVPKEQKNFQDEKSIAAQKPGTSTGGDLKTAATTEESPQSGQVARVAESQPTFAPETPAAAVAPARPTGSEADKIVILRKESTSREAEERRRENYKDQPRDDTVSGPNRSKSEPSPITNRRVAGLASVAQDRAGDAANKSESDTGRKKTDSDVETRQVSGRRFRRHGNTWVDAAYESSRATVNVARGSEQYRALIADEPGIRAIAEQLGGEVILVWKGRAYRIR